MVLSLLQWIRHPHNAPNQNRCRVRTKKNISELLELYGNLTKIQQKAEDNLGEVLPGSTWIKKEFEQVSGKIAARFSQGFGKVCMVGYF